MFFARGVRYTMTRGQMWHHHERPEQPSYRISHTDARMALKTNGSTRDVGASTTISTQKTDTRLHAGRVAYLTTAWPYALFPGAAYPP